MSKITKKELRQRCIDNETAIASLESILKENGIERQPQPKQLDQSVFDGLDEKWRFAAANSDGSRVVFTSDNITQTYGKHYVNARSGEAKQVLGRVDASNWQNSLIEREKKELTGSDLCRAMLKRGDKFVMCMVANNDANMFLATRPVIVHGCNDSGFISVSGCYSFAVAVNNQGEPLTASEVDL